MQEPEVLSVIERELALLLRVTPAADAQIRRIRDDRQQLFRRLLQPWPEADVECLGQLLTKFNALVDTTFEERSDA